MAITHQTIIWWKLNSMANQHYTIIDNPILEIGDTVYTAMDWNLNLKEFLIQNAGKQIYILESSITTNKIRAIVI